MILTKLNWLNKVETGCYKIKDMLMNGIYRVTCNTYFVNTLLLHVTHCCYTLRGSISRPTGSVFRFSSVIFRK